MIGQTIESNTRFSVGAVCLALIAIGFLVGGYAQHNIDLAVFAMLPLTIAAALWLAAGRRFLATVLADRIEFQEPRRTIAYRDLVAVYYDESGPTGRSAPLLLDTRQGVISVPGNLGLPLRQLHAFLVDQAPPPVEVEPHPDMANYVQTQRETFGSDRVSVFRHRYRKSREVLRTTGRGALVSLAVMFTGVVWAASSLAIARKDQLVWVVWGVLLVVFGLIFWMYFRQRAEALTSSTRHLADACLVISPLGIAMIQADMRGKLRWDEIRKVVSKGATSAFQYRSAVAGLQLHVDGSVIQILDIYDAPLSHIDGLIRRNL